jgi:hemerythrin-like domain-containing protein
MNFKIVKSELTKDELLKLLAEHFPEIKEELFDEDYADLIHLQIGLLANYANQKIEQARFDEVQRIFDFFSAVIDKVDTSIENAFYVSFLEHVNMDGENKKERNALKLLPNRFLQAYRTLRNPS